MEYLLLSVGVLIFFNEVMPTLTLVFEYFRTLLSSKIVLIQHQAMSIQEEIEKMNERMEKSNTSAIGFQIDSDIGEEYYEPEDKNAS